MNNTSTKRSIHYNDRFAVSKMSNSIIFELPRMKRNIIVLCIGTDRSTGVSFGPLTGTFLSQMRLRHIDVFGTLHQPVHALNLEKNVEKINTTYKNPLIIAIDASLGQKKSIGNFIYGVGSIKPGTAVKKELPNVGDIYITGVVNVGGFMEFSILQSTRLAIVHDMAYKSALTIKAIDHWLSNYIYINNHKQLI